MFVSSRYMDLYFEEFCKNNITEEFKESDVIVLDTETTGLKVSSDELLQVSIISNKKDVLFNSYFKPCFTTEWEAAQTVNGISPDMVKDCPSVISKAVYINNIIRNAKVIIGYNVNFDLSFLYCFGIVPVKNVRIIDVMKLFAPVYGELDEKYGSYKWQKLIKCADYYGFDWGKMAAHNSLADCFATLYCYEKMIEKGDYVE